MGEWVVPSEREEGVTESFWTWGHDRDHHGLTVGDQMGRGCLSKCHGDHDRGPGDIPADLSVLADTL